MTDNRTTELLPCPFCGGEAEIVDVDPTPHYVKEGHWVICKECKASAHVFENRDKAIEAWNTRTPEQAIAEELNAKRHVETCEMEYQTDGMMSGWWKCSVCGEAMDTIKACAGREKPKYCGNCGRLVVA